MTTFRTKHNCVTKLCVRLGCFVKTQGLDCVLAWCPCGCRGQLQGELCPEDSDHMLWTFLVKASLSVAAMLLRDCASYQISLAAVASTSDGLTLQAQTSPDALTPDCWSRTRQGAQPRLCYFHCLTDDLAWRFHVPAAVSNCALILWLIQK